MNPELEIAALRNDLREHNYNYYVLDHTEISDFELEFKYAERDLFAFCARRSYMAVSMANWAEGFSLK